ncbi:MAG: YjjG family noncanonical pyrimidine nucleotidase [Bacteroidetes bacterium]|nr:YjjG family noncanonical pyrimidine nucleotidase [Bacteroidota bacterium]MBS1539347.1 YjjG family noncanonical pyrimidine nucleotidase [Bacteroidota bacterium]
MKYQVLLFDLDHTLWDYETNSRETLIELHEHYKLAEKGILETEFLTAFYRINNELWDQYDRGLLHRDVIRNERFHRIFQTFGLDNYALSLKLSDDYIHQSPQKGNLVEDCVEILEYLQPRYPMVIVTNGFEEIQATKLHSSGIHHFFKSIVTSARAGHKKPAKEIFEFALTESGFQPHQAIMIGDNLLTDIAGAANANIDTVFFNPNGQACPTTVNHEIKALRELMNFL